MIPSKVDAVTQIHGLATIHSGTYGTFRISRGNFVGIVQPQESRYDFLVRDMRREQPTIHGCGVDFSHAVTAVTQLLYALTA